LIKAIAVSPETGRVIVKHQSRVDRRITSVSVAAGAMVLLCVHGISRAQPRGNGDNASAAPTTLGVRATQRLPPPPVEAQPPSAEPRDFAGIWLADGNPIAVGGPPGFGPEPPYTPAAAKQQQKVVEMIKRGAPLAEAAAGCRPSTLFRIGFDIYPAEIIQAPDTIIVLGEEGRTRWQIFMNRGHPKNVQPTFFGDSVGHWEGDTLVVDTIGLNGKVGVLSPQAHVTSKIRKTSAGRKLELTIVIEDTVNYTKPYQQTITSSWRPDLQMLEYQCEENLEGAKVGVNFEK
jgi:hypothetical protein